MNSAERLLIAIFADLIIGDPFWFPHPVRLIGAYVSLCDRYFRRIFSFSLLFAGILTGISVLLLAYFVVFFSIFLAGGPQTIIGGIIEILWIWLALSAGDLDKSVKAVLTALRSGDLGLARRRLSGIVGRDTVHLDESEVSRAAVETTAESFVDGILSPLFFYVLGGAPLMWAFKAVSTCDSMIGHKDEKYLLFGKFSARLDDFANFAPARIAFPLIFLSAFILRLRNSSYHPLDCARAYFRDSRKHSSPNAGIPEAAFAGALGLRLGGVNYYDGRRYDTEFFFPDGDLPLQNDIDKALKLMWTASLLAFFISYLILEHNSEPLIIFFNR